MSPAGRNGQTIGRRGIQHHAANKERADMETTTATAKAARSLRRRTIEIDRQVEAAFYRVANRVEINVMDLGKIYAAGKAAAFAGQDVDAAVAAAVAQYRQN